MIDSSLFSEKFVHSPVKVYQHINYSSVKWLSLRKDPFREVCRKVSLSLYPPRVKLTTANGDFPSLCNPIGKGKASASGSQPVEKGPGNSASQVSTSTSISQGSMDFISVLAVAHTASSEWKSSEPPFGSPMPNPASQVSTVEGTSVGNSAAIELDY
ncbi:hypothetical protein KIW84_012891 [Lathyrus oleraceus]|uniref:Uncharacterized protein n=1 Tax=Pisum sativum TaxID=3888 RepID=A0A9D5BJ54_PEA|nr:hypothetical protein KIW84_012891 [Pisum sativum]